MMIDTEMTRNMKKMNIKSRLDPPSLCFKQPIKTEREKYQPNQRGYWVVTGSEEKIEMQAER